MDKTKYREFTAEEVIKFIGTKIKDNKEPEHTITIIGIYVKKDGQYLIKGSSDKIVQKYWFNEKDGYGNEAVSYDSYNAIGRLTFAENGKVFGKEIEDDQKG